MSFNKVEKLLSLLLVLLIPSQLALHFWPDYSSVYGIRIDYLAPTIYLTDILAGVIIAFWFLRKPKIPRTVLYLLPLALVNILFASTPQVAIFKWIKVFEFIFLGLSIYGNKKLIGERNIYLTLLISLVAFSLIGILQFVTNNSWGREFYLLGAREFSITTPGIALTQVMESLHLRSYSTLPHPNALAGFLGLATVVLFQTKKLKRNKYFFAAVFVVALCFLLTFSFGAFIGLAAVLAVYLLPKIRWLILIAGVGASMMLPSINFLDQVDKSFLERIEIAEAAQNIIQDSILTGVGLGGFISNLPYSSILQPVHNIFLLVLAEVGVVGLGLLIFLFYKSFRSKAYLISIFIFVTSLFDHYWATSQQNLLLLTIVFSVVNLAKYER